MVQRESQIPAPSDEVEPPYVLSAEDAVVAGAAGGSGQDAGFLVEADCDDFYAGRLRKFSNPQSVRIDAIDPIVTIACSLG